MSCESHSTENGNHHQVSTDVSSGSVRTKATKWTYVVQKKEECLFFWIRGKTDKDFLLDQFSQPPLNPLPNKSHPVSARVQLSHFKENSLHLISDQIPHSSIPLHDIWSLWCFSNKDPVKSAQPESPQTWCLLFVILHPPMSPQLVSWL